MTLRSNGSLRVRAALGADWLTIAEIQSRTGMGVLGVKSTLTAMLAHKEVRRRFGRDGKRVYAARAAA
ncbi:hypothetical protein GCM10011408_21520 [Dyella caseinilytica]|nr:hypothetical protein GCM10011408_21520 [Dyella caseinilytica]